MALRIIRKLGEDVLRKKSRVVDEINERIITLLDDMKETLKDAGGIGLAAPQVGVLRRVFIISIPAANEDEKAIFIEAINPEIIESESEQIHTEGCLSFPGLVVERKRPAKVKMKALNRHGEEFFVEGEELLARAICHETDHLNGVLFNDDIIRYVD